MAIVKARVEIEGVRPLLMHKFGVDAIPLEKREKTGVAGNDPEEWKRTYSATKDGQLFVDPSYIFGCLREAGKYTKKGKSNIRGLISSCLQVLDDMILFDRWMPEEIDTDPTKPVYIDVRSVVNPSTKGRNIRYRVALSSGWKTSFTIMWDNTIVSRGEMESACHDAGMLVGLADGRSIGFGRFKVTSFEVIEDAQTKTA
jgi:hypothetical protein